MPAVVAPGTLDAGIPIGLALPQKAPVVPFDPGNSCVPSQVAPYLLENDESWHDYQLGDIVLGNDRYNYSAGYRSFMTEKNASIQTAFSGSLGARYATKAAKPSDLQTLSRLARDYLPDDVRPAEMCTMHVRIGDVIECDNHTVAEMLSTQVAYQRNTSTCSQFPDQTRLKAKRECMPLPPPPEDSHTCDSLPVPRALLQTCDRSPSSPRTSKR